MKKNNKKKKVLVIFIMICVLTIAYTTRKQIITWILKEVFEINKTEIKAPNTNEYTRNIDYKYVQNTNNFKPKNKKDLMNIYYTVINSGTKSFSFYCPEEYKKCISDVKEIANNKTTTANINNYVHPYNSFRHIDTKINKIGKVTLVIEKTYSNEKINKINKIVNKIIKEEIKEEKDKNEQIKIIHDYIINNTKYDSNKSDNKNALYDSDTAYGALIQGYALCGGYSDAMAIILDKLGIKNFKIASDNHIWNAVELDNNWYHLDLTWDDPITNDNSDTLEYNFYMITTEELSDLKTNYHNYDKNIYQEL